ncbi:3-carboxy-cis,cis-muconate cycloisomerase [Lactobacillus colini]|uniref:Adenylosuccinate lyase n=1 Tax=Lactobacillus colini TaxID=1819254 RepID=A0ABS4MBR0_9LACO|nr:adenylosuccinate lyase [Lactobacillus colini]MBP2057117.1 3-carboxy-cis,cis-muconate cycloisomerase [Lactobacillus colini]
MTSTPYDSPIYKNQYGTEEMRQVFSEKNQIQTWLDIWSALAQAEAESSIIPEKAAREIKEQSSVEKFDMDVIRTEIAKTSHPLMPQIRYLSSIVSPDAARWIHWGATTQDLLDTSLVLQFKQATKLIIKNAEEIQSKLLVKAKKYRNLVMAGRTNTQQAVPITLGYKFAVWADELGRDIKSLKCFYDHDFVGQFGGAAGSIASLGDKGIEVRNRMCELLNLNSPTITWHVARDRFAKLASYNAILAGTIGKIALSIMELQRTEIGELEEGFTLGKISSSTMPQKRNPMICDVIVSNCHEVQNSSQMALSAMFVVDERDVTWSTEQSYFGRIFLLLSAALKKLSSVCNTMIVHEDRIKDNLNMTNGAIVSERIMLVLGEKLGRQPAHEVVYEDAQDSFNNHKHLLDVLSEDKRITAVMSKEEIKELLNPQNYIGVCQKEVDDVLRKWSN